MYTPPEELKKHWKSLEYLQKEIKELEKKDTKEDIESDEGLNKSNKSFEGFNKTEIDNKSSTFFFRIYNLLKSE